MVVTHLLSYELRDVDIFLSVLARTGDNILHEGEVFQFFGDFNISAHRLAPRK